MKKIHLLIFALASILFSCNESIDYEQFEKKVLITKNGWVEQEIYLDSTNVTVPFVVSINGTTGNSENVKVQVSEYSDTLNQYNFEKYRYDSLLYYTQLPAETYSLDRNITIPAGEVKGVGGIRLNIDAISDIYADYVLPLAITSTSAYQIAKNSYSSTLLHLIFKNSFSGSYSGKMTMYKTNSNGSNDTSNKIEVSTVTLYALTHKQCYMYAGNYSRGSSARNKFIINIENDNGMLTLSSPNPDIQLKQESATIEVSESNSITDNRYKIVSTTLTFRYTYIDLGDITKPTLRAEGTISMNRDNVLK